MNYKKTILTSLLFILIIPIIHASASFIGNCNTTCNVTTPYYTANLKEGMIKHLWYTNISNLDWGIPDSDTTYGVAGVIYSGSFILSDQITATTCAISGNTANCTNVNASNFITFNDSFIKIISTSTLGSFRTYMNSYQNSTSGIHSISNGSSINSTNQGLTDWDSTTGSSSVNRTAFSNTSFIAFTWDETKTTDFDYTTNYSLSYPGIAIARTSEIAVNTSFTQYVKVLLINNSETGDNKILKPLQYFKANPTYGDIITSSNITQTSYYFSSSEGNDSNNCNATLPCQTINKSNSFTYVAGDNIYFKRGDTFRTHSASMILDSGNSSHNITYQSYGTGNAPKFLGSYNLSHVNNWTDTGSNIWVLNGTIALDIGELIMDNESNISTARRTTRAGITAQDNFYYNYSTDKIYMYSVGNPASVHNGIEASVKLPVIDFQSKRNIVIKGFDVRYSGSLGMVGTNSNYIYVLNNTVSFIGGSWVDETDSTRYGNCIESECSQENSVISYNNVSNCFDAGISTQAYSSCGVTNISNILFSYNIIDKSHYGYEFISTNTANVVSNLVVNQNTFYNIGGGVWAVSSGNQNDAYCLMGYTNPPTGTSQNWTNNICYNISNLGSAGNEYFLSVGRDSSTAWKGNFPVSNYNLYYLNSNTNVFEWNNTRYTNLSNFVSGTGKDVNSIYSNPLFVTNTYQPAYNSPACNMSSTGSYVGALSCAPEVIPLIITQPTNNTNISQYLNLSFTDENINYSNYKILINNNLVNNTMYNYSIINTSTFGPIPNTYTLFFNETKNFERITDTYFPVYLNGAGLTLTVNLTYTYSDGTTYNNVTTSGAGGGSCNNPIHIYNTYTEKNVTNIKWYAKQSGATPTDAYVGNGCGNFTIYKILNNNNQTINLNNYNLSIGINTLTIQQFNSTNTNIENASVYFNLLTNNLVNLSFRNIVTNASLNDVTYTINHSSGLTRTSTVNASDEFPWINGTSTVFIQGPNIVSYTTTITPGFGSNAYNITTYQGNMLTLSFKDMYNNANLTNVSINLTGPTTYNFIINNTQTYTNITSGTYAVLIGKQGYTSTTDTITITSTSYTNKTYYLTTNPVTITVYVKNVYDQYLSNAQVNISKTDQTLLYSKYTDSLGSTTFLLDTNLQYLVTATAPNYNNFVGIINPSTTTIIITLGTNQTAPVNYYSGIINTIYPNSGVVITNNTNQEFSTTYTSTDWNITNCYLQILDVNNTIINSTSYTSCNSNLGYGNITQYTNNYTFLKVLTILTVNATNTTQNISFIKTYSINYFYEGEYSLANAFRNFKNFNKSGFNNDNRLIIAFIVIFGIVIAAARSTVNKYVSSGPLLILTTLLILLASHLDFLNLGFNNASTLVGATMNQWGVAILFGVITFIVVIGNWLEGR